MRKALLLVLTTMILLSSSSTISFAAGSKNERYFADTDENRICDNTNSMCIYAYEDKDVVYDVCDTNHVSYFTKKETNFIDAYEDSSCDNFGTYHRCGMAGTGCGANFVDADGDGTCDNYLSGQGKDNGQGNGIQSKRSTNFVDADGDSICDNYLSGQGQGSRYRRGYPGKCGK